jgi:hypothetical protein
MPEQLWQALSYASIIAAAATLLIAFASMVLLATYLRDKSKSRYDEVHHRAEISEMRRSYEDHLKALTLQLTATDQRWKDLNHLLISSQRFEPTVQVADDIPRSNFLRAMGIKEQEFKIDPKLVLMLTPFNPAYDSTYQRVVDACRRVGLTCVRGDEEDAQGDILSHILRIMIKARLIIANIGSRNPNVYYELGIAHALDKPTILISETLEKIPFDIQSKRILIYSSLEELEQSLPETLARVLAGERVDAEGKNVKVRNSENYIPFIAAEPADGLGRLRSKSEYLCITNDNTTINLPSGPYIYLRLIPTKARPIMGDVETYRLAQENLRPMQGARASNWRVGRHNTGAVAFYPSPSIPDGALDASELFLTGELWANDFYFLDPTKERVRQRGFPFVPTGAVEEVLVDTLRNFIAIARDKMAIKVPVQVKTGLVGVRGFRLAVPPEYFAFSEMEGHILREAIVFETSLGDWSTHPFDILKPFFETIYDAAGLKRPDVRVAGRLQQ